MDTVTIVVPEFGKSSPRKKSHFLPGATRNPERVSRIGFGAHGAGETPVPMPNTAVKPRSGYNTWVIKPWENSTVPNYKNNHP